MNSSMLDWAIFYANIGWKILPIVPNEKRPLTKHGVKDATVDLAQIEKWWVRWPFANIAVACGAESGIYVIDIDTKTKAGGNGWKSLRYFPSFEKTVAQDTPRGGCHLFFKTDDPPANRNSLLKGVDIRGDGYYVLLAPSEGKDEKVYRWIGGQSPSECELAEYPSFMRDVKPSELAGNPRPDILPATAAPDVLLPGETANLRSRAAAYLRACDPAIQGEGGHDKLLWAAVAMVHKFKLTDSQVYQLLTNVFNPRCIPPWNLNEAADAKEFSRKITEARKLTPSKSFDTFLDGPGGHADVDVAQLVADHQKRQAEGVSALSEGSSFGWTGTEEALYSYLIQPSGLLGCICSWINSTSYRLQPMLTLACSLAFFGTLVGRRICGEDDTRTNLYAIGIAPSSSGKNHAMNKIRQLAYDSGCDDRIGGTKFASDSAIEKKLSDSPATLFICDEVGHMLTSFKNDRTGNRSGIIALLMELYSMASQVYKGKEYATQEQRILVQPCCSLYGVSEPNRFAQSISADELSDGWIARCLIFDAGSEIPSGRDVISSLSAPQDVIDRVANWETMIIQPSPTKLSHFLKIKEGKAVSTLGLIPNMVEVPYSDGAKITFREMDSMSIGRYNSKSDMGPVWMKSAEKAKRIALILAASESPGSPCVSVENAIYACRLVGFLLDGFASKVLGRVASNNEESMKQRIMLKILDAGQEGIGKSSLTRKTQWATKTNRNYMLADLIQGGFIAAVDINKRDGINSARHGLPVKKLWYWAIEFYDHEKHGSKDESPDKDHPANPEQSPVTELQGGINAGQNDDSRISQEASAAS